MGAIHAMCLLIIGITRYLAIALPYPLKLTKDNGFSIKDSAKTRYPLFIRHKMDSEKNEWEIR